MKHITLPTDGLRAWLDDPRGAYLVQPVILDRWFPPLTEDQILANGLAALDGLPEPFPDPNLVEIRFRRPNPTEG